MQIKIYKLTDLKTPYSLSIKDDNLKTIFSLDLTNDQLQHLYLEAHRQVEKIYKGASHV